MVSKKTNLLNFEEVRNLLFIFIILFICFTSKSWAQIDTSKEKYLENKCEDKDMNDGNKCFGLNDFLNQGYRIIKMTSVSDGRYIVFILEQKSSLNKNKIILCSVKSRSLYSFCKKP